MTTRSRRILRRVVVSLAIVVGLALPPIGEAAPARFPAAGFGFGDGAQMTWLDAGDVNRELDAVTKTGSEWLRVLIPWSDVEKVKGQYDWAQTDLVVNAAAARHLKVLGVIAYTPDWARPGGSYFTAPPDDAANYANFAATVASRYGNQVSDWQLWNEPNYPMFFGNSSNNAARYTQLVKAAYPAIKTVQPTSTVVLAGFSPTSDDESPPAFLEDMYAAGAQGFFDAAAAHPYVFPGGLGSQGELGWSEVGKLHGIMAAHGDGGKKIWLTELGAPTSDAPEGVSQQEQAKQITDVLAAAAATSFSGPAFVYSIRDTDTTNRDDNESNYGVLLTSDWQPKFAASVFGS
jgi:polysaccharide biosynthesis protein PslG